MSAAPKILLAALALVALSACERDGYCIRGCSDGEVPGQDAGPGAVDAGGPPDAGPLDAANCVPRDGAVEACDGDDDDCDGRVDEGFDLSADPANCGECGNECVFVNAGGSCVSGACSVEACFEGFVDLDDAPGCEYACPVFPAAAEDCNGFDDDCDGAIDEAVDLPPPPADLCRTTPGTICEGVSAICTTREGRTTWFCDYPSGVEFDPVIPNGIALEETRCDGFDGDCDGLRDEPFTTLGDPCDNGMRGACRDAGAVSCDPADASATRCDLSVLPDANPAAPSDEVCNAIDDDCDGVLDEEVVDDMVHVTDGGLDFYIYRHEASRPDADAASGGQNESRACGRGGALPWASVGLERARAACAAAGHRLCTGAEWQAACESSDARAYPYGAAYDAMSCNGADRDATPGGPIDSRIEPGGALPMCVSPSGALDLSGNVKEWTEDQRGTTSAGTPIHVLRGGSVESPRLGLSCQTDLSRATVDTLLPTVGFRCCSDTAP